MINHSSFPFVRFTLFFTLGIVGYHYLGESVLIGWFLLSIAFVLYTFLAFKNSYKYRTVISFLVLFVLFGLGAKRLEYFKDEKRVDHLLYQPDSIKAYKAILVDEPEVKSNSIKSKLQVYSVLNGGIWKPASGLVNGYLDKVKGADLVYGDMLFLEGNPQLTSPPANPGEFDYKGYLAYNRIHHQHFVGEKFTEIGYRAPNWFVAQPNKLRSICVQRLSNLITDDYARGVTLALVLGVKDELEDDLIQAFSATGAMHVLAVSGLHVGIIYAILLALLKRFGLSGRKHRWLLAIISISTLWLYALLTGLSPSVLRAVTMFTFVALGQAAHRKSSIYNTLAASAMALLIYNPYLIMSVGFQLSYLAVFGIVYLQPRLYNLFKVNNMVLDKVWAITCVSIAAQVATAPLSMLYFHQFPSYFLLSNLFVIPAAFIILIAGLVLLTVSSISVLASALGGLLTKFIMGLNGIVIWVSELPESTIEGIYLSILDTWLIYATIICLLLWLSKKSLIYLKYATLMCSFFFTSQLFHFSRYANSTEFNVLKVSNASVMDFRSGFQSKVFSDSSFLQDENIQRFHLYPKRLLSGSRQRPAEDDLSVASEHFDFGSLFVFDQRVYFRLNKEIEDYKQVDIPIEVDCLILGNNVLFNLKQLSDEIDFKTLIIDSTNNWYVDDQLVKQSKELNLNYHSIRQDGYYSERWKNNNL